jgi:aminopeptidase
MSDPRLENLAKTIVQYSTRVQPGDRVAIRGFPLTAAATPLINSITREVLQAGGYPHLLMTPPNYRKLLSKNANNAQLTYINPFQQMIMEEFEVDIRVSSVENTKSLTGLDVDRMNTVRSAYYGLVQTWFKRSDQGSLRWLTTRYPTAAYAQEAEMSLQEYEDYFYSSCFSDLDDPLQAFEGMSTEQNAIVELFKGGDKVKISGPDIELELSVKGRDFIRCIGKRNLPDGEIYSAPIEDSVNGWVHFSYPCIYQGIVVEGVEIVFNQGKAVEVRASNNQDYLRKTLQADDGADRLGEFGIGLNHAIDRFTGDMLFDEKIAGTIHLAFGAGYPKSGSENRSAIHWDMLVDLREDSEITLDGDLIYEDGKFKR